MRTKNQFQLTYEQDTVTIYGSFAVGASGAVASSQGGGIVSVTKESTAGQYTIALSEQFARFLHLDAQVVDDAVSQVAKIQLLEDPATLQAAVKTDRALTIQCLAIESDATPQLIAANPAEGALVTLRIVCRQSSSGPFDA